jgi:hypothetical protein
MKVARTAALLTLSLMPHLLKASDEAYKDRMKLNVDEALNAAAQVFPGGHSKCGVLLHELSSSAREARPEILQHKELSQETVEKAGMISDIVREFLITYIESLDLSIAKLQLEPTQDTELIEYYKTMREDLSESCLEHWRIEPLSYLLLSKDLPQRLLIYMMLLLNMHPGFSAQAPWSFSLFAKLEALIQHENHNSIPAQTGIVINDRRMSLDQFSRHSLWVYLATYLGVDLTKKLFPEDSFIHFIRQFSGSYLVYSPDYSGKNLRLKHYYLFIRETLRDSARDITIEELLSAIWVMESYIQFELKQAKR